MARVFFPTDSLNRFGVRDTNQRATLGSVLRFPAEAIPRAAMTPTPPILGSVGLVSEMVRVSENGYRYPYPVRYPVTYPIRTSMAPTTAAAPVSASGGGGTAPTPAAAVPSSPAPVSQQVLPTPTVTVPPQAPTGAVLVSSGGGTQTPATSTVVAPASSGLVDNVAAWLGGSTTLLGYAVPNAVLAGIVVLGFAWLSSNSGKKK